MVKGPTHIAPSCRSAWARQRGGSAIDVCKRKRLWQSRALQDGQRAVRITVAESYASSKVRLRAVTVADQLLHNRALVHVLRRPLFRHRSWWQTASIMMPSGSSQNAA